MKVGGSETSSTDVRLHPPFWWGLGINLRGESVHGLAAYGLFSRGIANWVIHAVIMVGLIRLQRTESRC